MVYKAWRRPWHVTCQNLTMWHCAADMGYHESQLKTVPRHKGTSCYLFHDFLLHWGHPSSSTWLKFLHFNCKVGPQQVPYKHKDRAKWISAKPVGPKNHWVREEPSGYNASLLSILWDGAKEVIIIAAVVLSPGYVGNTVEPSGHLTQTTVPTSCRKIKHGPCRKEQRFLKTLRP